MLSEECLRVRLADDVAEEGGDGVTPVALGRQLGIRRLLPREHPVDASACCSRLCDGTLNQAGNMVELTQILGALLLAGHYCSYLPPKKNGGMEYPKSKSTQPIYQPDGSPL